MKKLFFLVSLSAFAFTSSKAQKANISGTLHLTEPVHTIYLSYVANGKRVTDSSKVKSGNFHFTEKVAEPTLAMLQVRFPASAGEERPRMEMKQLFIEPGTIHISVKDSVKLMTVTGSKSQKAFEGLQKLEKPYDEKEEAMGKEYQQLHAANDTAGMKKIEDEFDQVSKEKDEKVYHHYLIHHLNSPVALYALNQYAGYDIDTKKIAPLFNMLPATTRNLPSGIAFKKRIATARKTGIGAYAMNFTQNDTLDKPVSLKNFRGKYVLLDFWASWCGPCRAENPNVVKAFNKYKDKNFTVLSVSLDQPGKKQAWLDAIHHDGLTWNHVSDLKFWDNAVAKEYGIRAIPQNLLIDPSGKIIAKNIRGEALAKKLDEVIP